MPKRYSFRIPESEFLEKPKRPTWALRQTCYIVDLAFDLELERTLCLTIDNLGRGTWLLLSAKQRRLAEAILRVPGVKTVELSMNQQVKFHISPRCDRSPVYPGVGTALSQVYGAIEEQKIAA